MSANPIIYCLEHLTDYRQFERLCSDLMAGSGFSSIEPIGGASDRGRDAIQSSRDGQNLTVFAYTVRSDWLVKLRSDCQRIAEERHNPAQVVFVCTSALSGSDKDKAKDEIKQRYGWALEIFDIERIRVLLSGELRHLLAQHPAIFCPPWFPTRGGLAISEAHDTVIIDHVSCDHSLANWLARRLSIAGYKIWCYGISPFVGEDRDDSIRTLIECRAVQYLPVISQESFRDPDFIARIGAVSKRESFVIPCWSTDLTDVSQSARILQMEPARFDLGWSAGLNAVLAGLSAKGVRPDLDRAKGTHIALQAYMPEPVTKAVSEKVYANVFQVDVPQSIIICQLSRELADDEIDALRHSWAFVKVSRSKLLSFEPPPSNVPLERTPRIPEYLWTAFPDREGKNSINVVKELIRRSLFVACARAGLKFCPERNLYYFSEEGERQRKVRFVHVDGRKTHVAMTGTKQVGWGDRASKFKYQLGPSFQVWLDEEGRFWITTRVYVRVTDLEGQPFREKEIIRKRKKVTKGWWNKEWLARTLGVMQGIANNEDEARIDIGEDKRRCVSISIRPLEWECPISIDVEAVDRIGDFQEEMASARSIFEDEELLGSVDGGELDV